MGAGLAGERLHEWNSRLAQHLPDCAALHPGYGYFGDVITAGKFELFKVSADSTDGGDRVSVSGPPAAGGKVAEYVVGGLPN